MARALGVRTSHFTLLVIYINVVTGQYFGEWLPIPNEVIFKRFNIDAPRFMHRIAAAPDVQVDENTINAEALKNDAIKLVQPQQFLGEFSMKTSGLLGPIKKEFEGIHKLPPALRNCEDKGSGFKCQNEEVKTQHNYMKNSTLAITRTGKKIEFEAKMARNIIEDLQQEQQDILNNDENKTLQLLEEENSEETYAYAVTENPEPIEDIKFTTKSTSKVQEASGYIYNRPIRIQNPVETNFTQKLFESLNKHNIHKQDKLPNYAKSRISNSKTMNTKNIYLPFPLRVVGRHNSLNHLPVDPLLAVFLSNYGYYLPRSYGSINEYRNLYGYLASNNIHNNKPFGLYKIFSDTDSSSL